MSTDKYLKEELWPILVETVHALVLYKSHKVYIRDIMMIENPGITATELTVKLNMPFGEALVILQELAKEGGLKSQLV